MNNKKSPNKLIEWEEIQLICITSQLGKSSKEIISKFANQQNLKILPLNFLVDKNHNKCCSNRSIVMLYEKKNLEIGRMRACCLTKLNTEIIRVTKQLAKPKKTEKEIYQTSYKAIRGSIGHIIFQAFLGTNEQKYIRESEHIKERSILRTVHNWVTPCSSEQWDKTISEFQKDPSEEKVKEIIRLYSPLYKGSERIIGKMSSEIVSYLTNLPKEWKKEEIRMIPTHVGIADIVVGEKVIEFKFTEKKIGWQKKHFEQLYRYYHSACKLNPEEKKKLKILCVFSPITGETRELTIIEAVKKWNLKQNFDSNFLNWQFTSLSNVRRTENAILAGKVKGPNIEEAKLMIEQGRRPLEGRQKAQAGKTKRQILIRKE